MLLISLITSRHVYYYYRVLVSSQRERKGALFPSVVTLPSGHQRCIPNSSVAIWEEVDPKPTTHFHFYSAAETQNGSSAALLTINLVEVGCGIH